MTWKIGNIEIKNQVTLAPMAGVTTPTFIKICESMGASYGVSELISAEAIVRNNQKTLNMLAGFENIKIPFAVQLFGSNPETMRKAAQILADKYKVKIIDINMGCPVPKVAIKNKAGSFLMKDPELAYEIVKSIVDNVPVLVTVKIRAGWDDASINAPLVAKMCEKAGAKAIFVHGRTRSQGYSGKVNLDVIKEVVTSVSVPVIGNGDITDCYKAKYMLDYTGCTAIMIGRGVLGNPWLIKSCIEYLENGETPSLVSTKEKIAMMRYYTNELIKEKGEYTALLELRTNLMYFLKGMPKTKEIKMLICKAQTQDEILKIIDDYAKELGE